MENYFLQQSGIILLDKPDSCTSNEALKIVKNVFNAQKAGHTGSLDPLATGMLPICLDEATKFSRFLLDADKRYQVRIRLGVVTSTGDSRGDILAMTPVPALTSSLLEEVLDLFRGQISQIPPMFSAIKIRGQRLYKMARRGVVIDRAARNVDIYQLKLMAYTRNEIELDVHCSKGTYIRSLAEDIGTTLGCGGCVIKLRRFAVGHFRSDSMITIEQLQMLQARGSEALKNALLPIESLINGPDILLSHDLVRHLICGQIVNVPDICSPGWVRIFSQGKEFLGVGHVRNDGRISEKRLLQNIDV